MSNNSLYEDYDHSEPNFWEGRDHYNKDGKKIGHSKPNWWDGIDYYDEHGNKIGHSRKNFWGNDEYYDANGKKVSTSYPNFFYGKDHYDTNGKKIGHSEPSMTGIQRIDYKSTGNADASHATHAGQNSVGSKNNHSVSTGSHPSSPDQKKGFWGFGLFMTIICGLLTYFIIDLFGAAGWIFAWVPALLGAVLFFLFINNLPDT